MMSPFATRPSSPALDHHGPLLSDMGTTSVLPRSSSASRLADRSDIHMTRTKERSHINIAVDARCLTLKGTGVDVEPVQLSGTVNLYLAEDTSLKDVTLHFKGKARVPISTSEGVASNTFTTSTPQLVYNHEWSFLEGDKRHARTMKAGRHTFPFQLQLPSSLPSTISNALSGSSIVYKLHAIAIRTGFNHNLHAIIPVHVVRSFTSEALEYQQSLELENTWPGKLMYSVILPHKAWAAGDKVTAVLKFSPISKGVQITRIKATIQETTKVYSRSSGPREHKRIIASVYHEIASGHTVEDPDPNQSFSHSSRLSGFIPPSFLSAFDPETPQSASSSVVPSPPGTASSQSTSSPAHPSSAVDQGNVRYSESNNDTIALVTLPLSSRVAPSHTIEPMIISHRVRWNVTLRNPDGHNSELRCSLPIHILDSLLLNEARAHSAVTRRLVLGSSDVPPEEEEDHVLPSYDAHIRDRVANMYLPEAATVRVSNPWISHLTNPTGSVTEHYSVPSSRARSGYSTPLEPSIFSHLPHTPTADENTPLDLVNSELLLSLSNSPLGLLAESRPPSDHASLESAPSHRVRSQPQSRHSSRPSSPDGFHRGLHHRTESSHFHHGRNFHHILRATMKPLTAITHPHAFFSKHHLHHDDDAHQHSQASPIHYESLGSSRASLVSPEEELEFIRWAYTEVPDYSIASRGFIGGVPPLETMQGLPSYKEAARHVEERASPNENTSGAPLLAGDRPGGQGGEERLLPQTPESPSTTVSVSTQASAPSSSVREST